MAALNDDPRAAIKQALSPGRFFVPKGQLTIEHRPRETIPWEVFNGHLLDRTQTRQIGEFETWNVVAPSAVTGKPAELLSVLLDHATGEVHVTRQILTYAWEPYESTPNVIESRQTQAWRRELTGTIRLCECGKGASLARSVRAYLEYSVIGGSRLPITSWESPLPDFSLGGLGYFAHPGAEGGAAPMRTIDELLARTLAPLSTRIKRAKAVELALRAARAEDVPSLAEQIVRRWDALGRPRAELPELFRDIFGHVALSPYTHFADNLVAVLLRLSADDLLGPQPAIDVIGYALRHLVRHLTAFDLVTFHNRGANYPDALFLDALLDAYLPLIDRHPEAFVPDADQSAEAQHAARIRRRALRQAMLIRSIYRGHPVPDAPTSPGENQRVLPLEYARVPDEQLQQIGRRVRTLFDAVESDERSAAATAAWRQSLADLRHDAELRELGLATFLDRPLGIYKQPGEADRTPLVSYTAYGRQIARERLGILRRLAEPLSSASADFGMLLRQLDALPTTGIPAAEFALPDRPGVVALEDARKAAGDLVFLRTTRGSLNVLLAGYDLGPLAALDADVAKWLKTASHVLLIRTAGNMPPRRDEPLLIAYDEQMSPRIELAAGTGPDGKVAYQVRDGVEYLTGGLRVLRIAGRDAACILPPAG